MFVILHMDHSPAVRAQFRQALDTLELHDVQLIGATDAAGAQLAAEMYEIDAAFVDLDLPGRGCEDVVRAILQHRPHARIAVLTAHALKAPFAKPALGLATVHHVAKPLRRARLDAVLRGMGAHRTVRSLHQGA